MPTSTRRLQDCRKTNAGEVVCTESSQLSAERHWGHPEEDSSQLLSQACLGCLGHKLSYACPVHASSDCTHLIHPSIHFSLGSSLSPFPSIYLSHLCLSLSFPTCTGFPRPSSQLHPIPPSIRSLTPAATSSLSIPCWCPQSGSPFLSPAPPSTLLSPLPACSPHGLHHCWPGTGWG